jgi:ABC-type multidrug transport system fused ATPase/permease subunit
MKNKTSIVIAHHLGTILHADTIFVMKDHQLAEHGTHEELMVAGGFYSGLYKIQHDAPTSMHAS